MHMKMVVSRKMYGRWESLFQAKSGSERSLFERRSGTRCGDGGRGGCEKEEVALSGEDKLQAHTFSRLHIVI